jgi:hypothetical protein
MKAEQETKKRQQHSDRQLVGRIPGKGSSFRERGESGKKSNDEKVLVTLTSCRPRLESRFYGEVIRLSLVECSR